jgi:Protein of unknown function (DUF1579)
MTHRTLFLLGLLTAAWFAAALTTSQAQQDKKKDPQAIVEPPTKPGIGQKFLEKFVGNWDVDKAFYPAKGEPTRSKGSCKQTMQQGGRFLHSEFTFGQGETKTTGLGIIGYEPDTGLFTSVWIDSRQTKMSLRQSREKFNGAEIVLFSGTLKDTGKPARSSRTVTRLEEDGRKIVHRQFNMQQDGKERLLMELLMTRK